MKFGVDLGPRLGAKEGTVWPLQKVKIDLAILVYNLRSKLLWSWGQSGSLGVCKKIWVVISHDTQYIICNWFERKLVAHKI